MSVSGLRQVRRALVSVSDKTGLVEFAGALAARGIELVSTGGTAKALAAAGLRVTDVAAVTGFPEMMDGRLKTLHPKVHGGLLALRDEESHARAMKEHGIVGIDLLVCNLYPLGNGRPQGFARRNGREHRHWWPGHDPRRLEEPWLCRRDRRR